MGRFLPADQIPAAKTAVTALLVCFCIVTAGCFGANSFGQATTDEDLKPDAELVAFKKVQAACTTTAEMGNNVTVSPMQHGDQVTVEYVIDAESPSATLNATVESASHNASTWVLNVTSHANEAENDSCTGQVKYSATIDVPRGTEYTILIQHDGARAGTVTQTRSSGGTGGESHGSEASDGTNSSDGNSTA